MTTTSRKGNDAMTTTTTEQLTCERDMGSYGSTLLCGRPAAHALSESFYVGGGRVQSYELLCNVHAAAYRRRAYVNPDALVPLDDAVRAAVEVRLAEQRAARAQRLEVTRERARRQHDAYRAQRLADYDVVYTSTLLLEERPWFDIHGNSSWEALVAIHPVDELPDGWNSYKVLLDCERDVPTTVDLRVPSPARLNPSAARELSAAMDIVGNWAAALNSTR